MSEQLRDLVVSLSLNSDNFTRNLTSINRQIQEAESEFRQAASGVNGFERSVSGTESKLSMLQQKLQLQQKAVQQYERSLTAAEKKLQTSADKQNKLSHSLDTAKQKNADLKDKVAAATEQYERFRRELGDDNSATIAAKENLDALKEEYAASSDEVKRLELGNNFATTESSIMNMGTALASAGSQVGLSEPQILGFATALSSVGLEAQAGGTAFSKAMIQMQVAVETGNDSLKDFAKVSGMTTDAFKALWNSDPSAAIQAFIVGLSKMDEQGISAIATLQEMGFTEVRLRDTLLRATNATDLFANAQETAARAWDENTALAEEAGKRYATTESKLQNLKNTATLAAQQIGNDLSPMFQKLVDGAKQLIEKFKALTESTREELEQMRTEAQNAGYSSVADQLTADIETLDSLDAEIEALLKKRQNGYFSEADQIRLQELIDTREAIEVKYHLSPADVDGFDTIRQKLEAEVARAQARGQSDADVMVYENAMVAAAEGLAAMNSEIDAQYDKEYALIQLIEDSGERQAAMDALNAKYVEDRRNAAMEYAQLLSELEVLEAAMATPPRATKTTVKRYRPRTGTCTARAGLCSAPLTLRSVSRLRWRWSAPATTMTSATPSRPGIRSMKM